jgi:hypothetical protein
MFPGPTLRISGGLTVGSRQNTGSTRDDGASSIKRVELTG